MGPNLIFDKSALQSLSIDESVWLNNFFFTNITPLFYIETLADLSLPNSQRPPERIISELAAKTPDAVPNAHHGKLVLGDLLGYAVEMGNGRPIVDRGETKRAPNGEVGVQFDESPESRALHRWHKGEYHEIEREFARKWRQTIEGLEFETAIGIVKNILPKDQKFSSLEQIKVFVDEFVQGNSKELLFLALEFLGIPNHMRMRVYARWEKEGRPTLQQFAPYAAYVLTVDLLFYIAALRGIIAKEKRSNKVDMAYLYYLPFCHVFVSGDKLHAKTVPLFLRKDQSFVQADDFKHGLSEINTHYLQFTDEIAEVGVMQFAHYPPLGIETIVHKLWDANLIPWRQSASQVKKGESLPRESERELLARLKKFSKESQVVDPKLLKTMDEADHIIVKHRVPVQKGRWRILPKGIEDKKPEE